MQIEQHQIRRRLQYQLHRAATIRRLPHDFMTQFTGADLVQDLAKHLVIFDNDNPHAWQCAHHRLRRKHRNGATPAEPVLRAPAADPGLSLAPEG